MSHHDSAVTASAIARSVSEALSHWTLRRAEKGLPVATEEECDLFREKVMDSIHASQERKDNLYDESKERTRRKELAILAAEMEGVKFLHDREYNERKLAVVARQTVGTNIFERKEIFEHVKSSVGGRTFAYKYRLDDRGDLQVEFSVAFCNTGGDLEKDVDGYYLDVDGNSLNDEGYILKVDGSLLRDGEDNPVLGGEIPRTAPDTFDPVKGMEVALERFQNNETIITGLPNGFSPAKLKLMASAYKRIPEVNKTYKEEE